MPRIRSNYGIIGTTQSLVPGTVRSGMFSGTDQYNLAKSSSWPFGGATDANFKNTTLLLSARNFDTNIPLFYKDASTNNFALTVVGDTRASNFSPYNTAYSNYFNGSSALVFTSGSQFNVGAGAYTLEGWINFSTAPNNTYLFGCLATNGLCLYYSGTSTLTVFQYGGTAKASATFTPTLGIWYHIAAARANDGTTTIWINGTSYTRTVDTTSYSIAAFSVGGISGGFVTGNINNVRLTLIDVYGVSNDVIGVPTQNLTAITFCSILTSQSNRFIDNSLNNAAVTLTSAPTVVAYSPFTETDATTASAYFDGTGDYLSTTSSSAFAVGTAFTFECWIYPLSSGGVNGQPLLINTTTGEIQIGYQGATAWGIAANGTAWRLTSTTIPTLNTWNHLVVVRSGLGTNQTSLFLNGVRVANGTVTDVWTNAGTAQIGLSGSGTYTGYISNLRLVKGTAVYDPTLTTITVPTTPLTAVTNTQLLTLQTRQNHNNSAFLDGSSSKTLITRNGNVAQGTFTPFSQTGWSTYFSGGANYLSMPSASSPIANEDFTIECWYYPISKPSNFPTIYGNYLTYSASGIFIADRHDSWPTKFNVQCGSVNATSTTSVVNNTWYHIAVTRSSGTLKLYINGVLEATTAGANSSNTPDASFIGRSDNASIALTYLNAYVSNFRIVRGTAVYTAAFIPPTLALTAITNTVLLTCQSNRFIDNSTNNYTIAASGTPSVQAFSPFSSTSLYSVSTVGGSAYFDGTGDYLTTAYTVNWSTAGSYTFECWIYPTVLSGTGAAWIATVGTGGTGFTLFYVYQASATNPYSIAVGLNGTNEIRSGNNLILPGSWYHVAYTYDGTTTKIYLNGTQVVSGSTAVYANNSGTFNIGGGSAGTYFTGYISNVRLVRGSVLYTSTFTVPTAPPAVTTNTVLLLNFTNPAIIDYVAANNLETVGDAKLSTAVTKFNNASMFFDGTGDALTLPASQNLSLGTGDFTIEMWVNGANNGATVGGSYPRIFALGTPQTTSTIESYNAAGTMYVEIFGASITFSASILLTSTWNHFAVSRSGTSMKAFVNGTQVGSTLTNSSNLTSAASNASIIGATTASTGNFNGYIDDLRITKGIARYTANFATPTSTLPAIGFTPIPIIITVDYLVVAGGGGGAALSGGGGGGGFRTSTGLNVNATISYTVTVGAGGAGAGPTGSAETTGTSGSNSVFSDITSTGGGGGGGANSNTAGSGGSGGGGSDWAASARPGGAGNTPSTTPSQGNNGGSGSGADAGGGGGGGASAVGANGTAVSGGAGGNGASSSISGSSVTYAGGGGGGAYTGIYSNVTGGAGGAGGGGAGGVNTGGSGSGSGTNGTTNRGGGGGGGTRMAQAVSGGAGGSGIVIIAYPDSYPAITTISVGLTSTYSTVARAGYRVYTFTAGTGTISW